MEKLWHNIEQGIVYISDFICGYPLFILLIGGGLFFLIYSGFAPFSYYKKALTSLKSEADS